VTTRTPHAALAAANGDMALAEASAPARTLPPRPPSFAIPLPVEMFRKGLFN